MNPNKVTEAQMQEYINLSNTKNYDKNALDEIIHKQYKSKNAVELEQGQMETILINLRKKPNK